MADMTNYDLVRNTGIAVDPIAGAISLVCTPTAPTNKLIIIITNTDGVGAAITVNIAKGDYWAGVDMEEVSIADAESKAFCFEGARFQENVEGADDTITLTISAATNEYQVIQLP